MDVSPNRHAAAECYHWAMIKQPDPTKRNEVFYFHLLGWRQIQPETAGMRLQALRQLQCMKAKVKICSAEQELL